jgi:hypothetical protein
LDLGAVEVLLCLQDLDRALSGCPPRSFRELDEVLDRVLLTPFSQMWS